MNKNLDKIKQEIISRLDIRAECEALGIQFVGNPNAKGWLSCHNPYRNDDNPSCGICIGPEPSRGYLVAFNMGNSGKPYWAVSFFDIVRDFGNVGTEFKDILNHYANKTGVKISKTTSVPPTPEIVEKYVNSVPIDILEYLKMERGLSSNSVKKYKVGWSERRGRITFPVYGIDGDLVNIRFYGRDKKPKMLNLTGYGQARLWGADRLSRAKLGSVICITEGEFDAMICEQETGLLCVSPTNGCNAFLPEWVNLFHSHHVVLVWDCDEEGRQAVNNLVLPSFKKAVKSGEVLSIKVIWLFHDDSDKEQKDVTDFIVKNNGNGDRILKIIEDTEPHQYPLPSSNLPEPIVLNSFVDIDKPEYAGQRVSVPLYVYGENSETYHAPTEVEVTHCTLLSQGKCKGRADSEFTCEEPIIIHVGDRVQLAAISSSDTQLIGLLRRHICHKDKRPALNIQDSNRITLREVYAHQAVDFTNPVSMTELIEKPVYIVGSDLVPIGKYQATGFVHTNPRNQKPTILIDAIEQQEEDWANFNINNARTYLESIKAIKIENLLKDVADNVTRIYERDDIHLGVLLSLCSPRWIHFPGDGRIRGWVSAIVIGDTGTGKTTVSETIFNYLGIGYRVSGMTSSRTGITYACDHDERRGWRIKAGALLKMSRQALIIDEAQDLEEYELKTMAEAMDSGRLKIDRIQNKVFEAETRCFFSCNPKAQYRHANQRTMDSFRYGCQALMDIFPAMMIRRVDLSLFATSHDIEDKSKIYIPKRVGQKPKYLAPEHLRALVYFAWNLRPDQIIISDEIAGLIRQRALELSRKFGGCPDLPIVYSEDFRKNFCRLVVALAVLDLSTDEEFNEVMVSKYHVEFMATFLDSIYSANNCRLDAYAKQYREKHGLEDPEEILLEFEIYMSKGESVANRICFIVNELLQIDPIGTEKISQKYFIDQLGISSRTTLFKDMAPLMKYKLVSSSRGYKPTTKLFQLVNYVDKYRIGFFDLTSMDFESESNG